jgi:hypothetical protein
MKNCDLVRQEKIGSFHYFLSSKNPPNKDLTPDNVYRIEAMIASNSSYRKSSDITAGRTYGKKSGKISYNGSSAYWIEQLKHFNRPNYSETIGGHSFTLKNVFFCHRHRNRQRKQHAS